MIRTALLTATVLVSFALPGFAQAVDKEKECLKIGQIVTNIVTERKNGTNERRAERRVLRDIPDVSKNDEALAAQLVSWIYGLPENQLTPEISQTLYQTCLSQ